MSLWVILVKAVSLYSSRDKSANLVILRVTPELEALLASANKKLAVKIANLY
jgi:hypothetical protein